MIIDFHAHPVFSGTPIHPGVDRLSQAYYGRDALKLSAAEFIQEMEGEEIDRAVLLPA